jgi:fatty acid desaturase
VFGFTPEHDRKDKLTAVLTVGLVGFWFLVFVIGTIWALVHLARGGTQEEMTRAWLQFWHWRIWLMVLAAAFATVVLAIGGVGDLRRLFAQLRTAERDDTDDGIVR